MQGVGLEGMLILPAGCCLHAVGGPRFLNEKRSGSLRNLATELCLRGTLFRKFYSWPFETVPGMRNLTRLRVDVHKEDFDGTEEHLIFNPVRTPNLEVLELNVSCNMRLYIDQSLALQSLVVFAAGALRLYQLQDCGPPASFFCLKCMYLHSGVRLEPDYKNFLKGFDSRVQWAGKRLLKYIKKEKASWTARKPAGFQPGSLQDCCCGACRGCLMRAGVPIP